MIIRKKNGLICIELLFQADKDLAIQRFSLPARWLFYLDPNRDYICVRNKHLSQKEALWQEDKSWLEGADPNKIPKDLTIITEISEFGKTNNGRWYPKRIERWDENTFTENVRKSIDTVYLNTNPEFPDGIFDPNMLPKTE